MRVALPLLLLTALALPGVAAASPLDALAVMLRVAPRYERIAAPQAPGQAGMLVERDAETGTLRVPGPAAAARLRAQEGGLDRSDVGLLVIHHPDGSRSVDLEDRFQEYYVVTRGADGRLHHACVDHARHALVRVHAPAAPAVAEER